MIEVKEVGANYSPLAEQLAHSSSRGLQGHVPCLSPLMESSAASAESIKLPFLGVVLTFWFAFRGADVLFDVLDDVPDCPYCTFTRLV